MGNNHSKGDGGVDVARAPTQHRHGRRSNAAREEAQLQEALEASIMEAAIEESRRAGAAGGAGGAGGIIDISIPDYTGTFDNPVAVAPQPKGDEDELALALALSASEAAQEERRRHAARHSSFLDGSDTAAGAGSSSGAGDATGSGSGSSGAAGGSAAAGGAWAVTGGNPRQPSAATNIPSDEALAKMLHNQEVALVQNSPDRGGGPGLQRINSGPPASSTAGSSSWQPYPTLQPSTGSPARGLQPPNLGSQSLPAPSVGGGGRSANDDEALARALQEDYNRGLGKAPMTVPQEPAGSSSAANTLEDDEALARALQDMDWPPPAPAPSPAPPADVDTDMDAAIALSLQEEFERESGQQLRPLAGAGASLIDLDPPEPAPPSAPPAFADPFAGVQPLVAQPSGIPPNSPEAYPNPPPAAGPVLDLTPYGGMQPALQHSASRERLSAAGSGAAAGAAGAAAGAAGASASNCVGCGKWIMWGTAVELMGRRWHEGCLKCGACGGGFGAGAMITVGNGGEPFHPDCHRRHHHPKCTVCGDFIPVQPDGRIMWQTNSFWKEERFCPAHLSDGTPECCACNRRRPLAEQWVALEDGRQLCLACLDSIVVDTNDCQPLYQNVLAFYARSCMPLPSTPPMMLVEASALNAAEEREGRVGGPDASPGGHSHNGPSSGPVFHTRGLCLSEEYRSMRVAMRPGGGQGWAGMVPQVVSIPGPAHCQVTAILALYGLPRLLTGSILAHEAMHAWLRMNGVADLSLDVEEGLCQLMALLWLEGQDLSKAQGSPEERLASYFAHQIRTDPSHIYGDGFRAAHAAFQSANGNLPAVLDHVRQTGTFPPE